MSLFTQHVYVMQSKTLSDMTNNVFIRFFKYFIYSSAEHCKRVVISSYCTMRGTGLPSPRGHRNARSFVEHIRICHINLTANYLSVSRA